MDLTRTEERARVDQGLRLVETSLWLRVAMVALGVAGRTFAVRHLDGSWTTVMTVLGVACSALALVGWQRTAAPAGPARTLPLVLVSLAAAGIALDGAFLFVDRGPAASALSLLAQGDNVAELVLSWLVLTMLGQARGVRPPSLWTRLFWIAVGGRVLYYAATYATPFLHATYGTLGFYFSLMMVASLVVSTITVALSLALVRRVRRGVPSPAALDAHEGVLLRSPGQDLLVGGLWLAGGLAVTIASFAYASQGGGRYVVATGAIAYGLVRMGRALARG